MIMSGSSPYSPLLLQDSYALPFLPIRSCGMGAIVHSPLQSGFKQRMLRSRNWRLRGLGQSTEYMAACTGANPNCAPTDQVCVANWQNVVNACNQQYVSDPNSPHNLPGSTEVPAQMDTSSQQYLNLIANAGGSVQSVEQSVGESVPPGTSPSAWWSGPGATVMANTTAPPPTSVQPAGTGQQVVQPTTTPSTSTSVTATGGTPWWQQTWNTIQGYQTAATAASASPTDTTDLISGVPNWLLFAGGVLVVAVMMQPHK